MSDSTEDHKILMAGFVHELWPAIVFAVLYWLLGIIFLIYINGKKNSWYIWNPLGALAMGAGLIVRAVSHFQPYSLPIYIIQYLYILLAPSLFIAQMYIVLPRLATSTTVNAPNCLRLRPNIVLHVFLTSDFFTYALQGLGGGLTVRPGQYYRVGKIIVMVGLVGQLLSYLIFTLLIIDFGVSVKKRTAVGFSKCPSEHSATISPSTPATEPPAIFSNRGEDWRELYWAMLWASAGFIIRSAYRVAEYSYGPLGYLSTHEVFFYCFDALPVLLGISVFVVIWPRWYISTP